jgi:tripartite-type tricarboxylate transporter receptor subunit TctC
VSVTFGERKDGKLPSGSGFEYPGVVHPGMTGGSTSPLPRAAHPLPDRFSTGRNKRHPRTGAGAEAPEALGQQVVIENRGGASTAIATEIAARSAPDGHTILLNAPGHATNPTLKKLSFDSIKDFAFITLLAESQNLLVVHPSLPATSVKSLIAISKQRPGDINYGTSGIGTTPHMSAELFQYMTGTKWAHIPYKGSGQGLTALLSGEFSLYFANIPAVIRHVQAGRLRPIVLSGDKRTPLAPDIPTVAESGIPGFSVKSWVRRRGSGRNTAPRHRPLAC